MLFVMILAGCKNSNIVTNTDSIEHEEIITESEIKKKLEHAENRIKDLEKQISDLKEASNKTNEEKKVAEDHTSKYHVLRIEAVNNHEIKYVFFNETNIPAQSVIIVGENNDNIVEEYEEIQINGLGTGEYFKAEIVGSIYDFQLVKLQWNDDTEKLEEVSVIHELEEVRNQTIYIETYLPCGIPQEKIKWEDSKGNQHEVFMANDGYGFDGSIIWTR